MKSFLHIAFLIIFCSNPVFASDSNNNEIKFFIKDLIQQGYDLFHDPDISRSELEKETSRLIRDNLHLNWMANYTLGRHKKSLTQEKISEFTDVYKKFVVLAYTSLSNSYDGEKAIITSVQKLNDFMFMVNLEIAKPNSTKNIKVAYLVHKIEDESSDKIFLIGDVITEGVSILHSQQSEFSSVISQRGFDSLIGDLKNRLKRIKNT